MLPGRHLVVQRLEDYSMDFAHDGLPRRKHEWTEIMHQRQSWATLLVCYREAKGYGTWSDPYFKLVRMRWVDGLWRRINTFNLKSHHLPGLANATSRALEASL